MASEHISKVQKLTKSIELMLKTVLAGAGYASGHMEVLLGRRLIARGTRGQAPVGAPEEPPQIDQQSTALTLSGQRGSPPGNSNPNGPTILVVEPQASARAVTRMALEREGYVVIEAENGSSALKLLSQAVPHLLLQNLVLPDMDGLGLAQWLRTIPEGRSVPIVAMSDSPSLLEQARSRKAGFTGFLVRPCLPSYLLQSIHPYFGALKSQEGMPPYLWRNRVEGSTAKANSPSESHRSSGRILLVEANEFQCLHLSRHLGSLGFQVISVRDGWDALNEAKTSHPDVVISNPLAPCLDGFGLCMEFRNDPTLASIPLILSPIAAATEFDIELARALGAAGYVSRTPNLEALIACVKTARTKKLGEHSGSYFSILSSRTS